MSAHKYFRRKVSEHPDFLIKVKNLYIPVTEEGDIFKAFALYLRPVTVGSGRTDKSEGEPFARHQAKNTSDRRPAGFEIRRQKRFDLFTGGFAIPHIIKYEYGL